MLSLDALPFPDNPSSGSVLDHLIQKHCSPHSINEEAVILPNSPSSNHEPLSILFEGIEGRTIKNAALRVSGPSGIDTMMMRRLCVSFGSTCEDICNSLALVARRLCSSYVDPDSLSAFLSCWLIALDKCPGVRPIGIGETCRRVIAKAVLWFLRDGIIDSVGPIQTCAGQQGGQEASVHAMGAAFQFVDLDALLLVDASNAFNSLNRGVALRNILYLCHSFARILINTYRSDVRMFINGQTIVSSEGTTQCDPLPMSMYALATLPFINHLPHPAIVQSWYANDASAAGCLQALCEWVDTFVSIGPSYGYFQNATKTCLLVKQDLSQDARTIFQDTQISITTDGRPVLGSPIGSREYVKKYVTDKVSEWEIELRTLLEIAKSSPHSSYAAFTHDFSSKWTFLCRTCPNIDHLLQPLEKAIQSLFIPSLTGRAAMSDPERHLLNLPVRYGGMGLTNPSIFSDFHYQSSIKITSPLVDLILMQASSLPTNLNWVQHEIKKDIIKSK